jgi:hypothetical protein
VVLEAMVLVGALAGDAKCAPLLAKARLPQLVFQMIVGASTRAFPFVLLSRSQTVEHLELTGFCAEKADEDPEIVQQGLFALGHFVQQKDARAALINGTRAFLCLLSVTARPG